MPSTKRRTLFTSDSDHEMPQASPTSIISGGTRNALGKQPQVLDKRSISARLNTIQKLDGELHKSFCGALLTEKRLTRQIVSFQANKIKPQYRWYKYKEAFSADLVEHLLGSYEPASGIILDPFAGSGTALFVSASLGFDADGIELLPVGQKIIEARSITRNGIQNRHLKKLEEWSAQRPWETAKPSADFTVMRITKGAYPEETEKLVRKYLARLQSEKGNIRIILLFALLCVLESISYTRKDGQYLRWDHRSGRRGFGKKIFNKGTILPFNLAIGKKIEEIVSDLTRTREQSKLFPDEVRCSNGKVNLLRGSCLAILPRLTTERYSAILTSPPYCNRYDYTRTYALEHAILKVSEKENAHLRQSMISCTVENREKELLALESSWEKAISVCDSLTLLSEILSYLNRMKENHSLNNNGIPRMVRGYFYEMACVIQECYRVLQNGGYMFMVNDNVRYAGASISVDLILSKIAEQLGFQIENILSLPQFKGNSSQQMGLHGKDSLRKCVYVWRKK